MNCVICGKEFENWHPLQKACGGQCSKRYKDQNRNRSRNLSRRNARLGLPKQKKLCAICGKQFETIHWSQKSCSGQCAKELQRRRSREYQRKDHPTLNGICVICGLEFISRRPKQKAHPGQCAKELYRRSRDAAQRRRYNNRPKIKKTCVICGQDFWTPPSKRKRTTPPKRQPTHPGECAAIHKKQMQKASGLKWYDKNRDVQKKLMSEYHSRNASSRNTRMRAYASLKAPLQSANQRFFLSIKLGEVVQKQKQNDTMENQVTTKTPTVQQFIESFISKLKGIEDSCKELALMVEANPNVFDEIVDADQRFNYNMLESMRRVGKGELYCELLFDPSMAARKLLGLPCSQQRKLYNEPTKIVKSIGGKNVVEEKMLQKMSRHELTLVIDDEKGRARTVEEQIAFVRPPTPSKRAERFEITNGKIKVLADTEFTVAQWIEIGERARAKELKALPEAMKANQLRS